MCQAQTPTVDSGDWPWWRGPSSNGVAEAGQRAPLEWSSDKNVSWKASVPGRGHSSPIVVGQRVFLTTADERNQVQSVLCFDRGSGQQLWQTNVNKGGFPSRINRKNTHASSSVACDGNRLYSTFFNHDRIQVVALGLDGTILWNQVAGRFTPDEFKNGYAASPLLYGQTVVVAGDFDGKAFLAALDTRSGESVWRTSRPSRINYASPIVGRVAGRDQLLISGGDRVASYNPHDGKPYWEADATTMATAGTMVWDSDRVYASGGYPQAETVCVLADGSGKVLWRNRQKCYEQSLLAVDNHVYAINDGGIAFCWQGQSGKELWRERLQGPISASPILSDGNIYASNERGTTWIYRATPDRFELVAENRLGSESFATPTICGSQVFLRVADTVNDRRRESLYCIETRR